MQKLYFISEKHSYLTKMRQKNAAGLNQIDQITGCNLVNFRVKADGPDCPICPIYVQIEIP
jgi:hypothetical protein